MNKLLLIISLLLSTNLFIQAADDDGVPESKSFVPANYDEILGVSDTNKQTPQIQDLDDLDGLSDFSCSSDDEDNSSSDDEILGEPDVPEESHRKLKYPPNTLQGLYWHPFMYMAAFLSYTDKLSLEKTCLTAEKFLYPGLLKKYQQLSQEDRNSQLMQAAEMDQKLKVELLLEVGAKIELSQEEKNHHLLTASEKGQYVKIKLFLDHGADVNTKQSRHKETPLIFAARFGHESVVKLLLENNAIVDLQAMYPCYTALMKATIKGHAPIVELLLAHGANPNLECGHRSNTLTLAVDYKHANIVKLLLDHGAKIQGKAFLSAAKNGESAIVDLFLDHEANLYAQDSYGNIPFTLAAFCNNYDTVKVFLDHGIDPNLKVKMGWNWSKGEPILGGDTALTKAIKRGNVELVKLLIAHGADVNLKGNFDMKPLKMAHTFNKKDDYELAFLLYKHGARL